MSVYYRCPGPTDPIRAIDSIRAYSYVGAAASGARSIRTRAHGGAHWHRVLSRPGYTGILCCTWYWAGHLSPSPACGCRTNTWTISPIVVPVFVWFCSFFVVVGLGGAVTRGWFTPLGVRSASGSATTFYASLRFAAGGSVQTERHSSSTVNNSSRLSSRLGCLNSPTAVTERRD